MFKNWYLALSILTAIAFTATCLNDLMAQSTNSQRVEVCATASFDLQDDMTIVNVALESVPVNSDMALELTLVNIGDESIPLNHVTASCGCSKISFPKTVLKKNVPHKAEVFVKLPPSSPNGMFSMSLELKEDLLSDAFRTIRLSVPLSGSLSVDNSESFFQVVPGLNEWNIPILYTAPITHSDLVIESDFEEDELIVALRQDTNQRTYLAVQIVESAVPVGGISGIVTIRSEQTGIKVMRHILIVKKEPITLTPRTLRFKIDDADSAFVTASTLIRLNNGASGNPDDDPSKLEAIDNVIFECNGNQIRASLKPLGNSSLIYRATIRLDSKLLGSNKELPAITSKEVVDPPRNMESNDVKWIVSTNKGSYSVPADFSLKK